MLCDILRAHNRLTLLPVCFSRAHLSSTAARRCSSNAILGKHIVLAHVIPLVVEPRSLKEGDPQRRKEGYGLLLEGFRADCDNEEDAAAVECFGPAPRPRWHRFADKVGGRVPLSPVVSGLGCRALGFGFLVTGSVSDPEVEVHVTDVTSVHLCLMKHLCLMLRLRYMCVAS
jgi:hypothetical protein